MDDIPVPIPSRPTRFMDRLREFMRSRHLAYRTEKTYCTWIRDFIRFHQMRRPEEMGAAGVDNTRGKGGKVEANTTAQVSRPALEGAD